MDKIFKFLRKRRKKERLLLMAAIDLIERGQLEHLDIKKLTGFDKYYRVRVGKFRIIFEKIPQKNQIIKVDEKDDQTYKF